MRAPVAVQEREEGGAVAEMPQFAGCSEREKQMAGIIQFCAVVVEKPVSDGQSCDDQPFQSSRPEFDKLIRRALATPP